MFKKHLPSNEDRGQVGIGTLIVFIAMVLVAAIAAGVLINTAGFLQQQSQETGEQSTNQISNSLQVKNELGVATASSTINQTYLTVSKSPGAEAIDLADLTITVSGPNGEIVLSYLGDGTDTSSGIDSTSTGSFELGAQIGDGPGYSTSSKVLSESDDKAVIIIPFDQSGAQTALSAGQDVTMEITTSDGATARVVINVPQPLSQYSTGDYVEEV